MTFISGVSTALPKWRYSTDQIIVACSTWLSGNERLVFEKFSNSSQIKYRHFAVPIEEVLTLKGLSQRVKIYKEEGVELASKSAQELIQRNYCRLDEIKTLIWSSCSVPTIPSIDIDVADRCQLATTINRIPIYQHGCVGGAIGLSLGARLCSKEDKVLIICAELCSLVHQSLDTSGGNLLGAALFGDGASCALLSQDSGPIEIIDSQTFRIPDSGFALGYTINDLGTFLKLDKELPGIINTWMPKAMHTFLKKNELEFHDIKHFLVHPGGAKILESFERNFEIKREQLRYSWKILAECGNISSAAIFHVIENFLAEKSYQDGDYGVIVGFGPGVTLQTILFRCHS